MSFRNQPVTDKPRERLARLGVGVMTDAELLAIVLGKGAPGSGGPVHTAEIVLDKFPDLRRLAVAGLAEIAEVPGVGFAQACRIKAALALAGRLSRRPWQRGEPFRGPLDVFRRLGARLGGLAHEVFVAVGLDVRKRVLFERQVAEGGACSVELIPRDVFSLLVREAAAGVVFIHNHPSGDPTPSEADRLLTQRLNRAGKLVGIELVDHIVVAQQGYRSLMEDELFRALAGEE